MTTLLDQVEALPQPSLRRRRRGHRRVFLFAVIAIAAVTGAAVLGTAASDLRSQVANARSSLAISRQIEAVTDRSITGIRRATGAALATRGQTIAADNDQRTQLQRAYNALTRLERNLVSTDQTLSQTQAAQVQIAQYSALRDACITGVRHATSALQQGDPAGAIAAMNHAASACSAALAAATGARFPYDFPDPSVLVVGSRFYAYSTNSGAGNIQVLVSNDLVHWSIVGDGLVGLPSWASRGATWAPAVVARASGFVAYYTVREITTGRQCISLAVAASPGGPFVDATTGPLVCQTGGSIDPSPFVDASGTEWLLWKSEANPLAPTIIWSQPLSADGLTPVGIANQLLTPGESWERGVVEAPSMIAIGGRDYLFYSGGYWPTAGYSEGVAVCDGAAGPCRRVLSGPVLASSGRIAGPGGGAAFTAPNGAVWLAFHAFTQPEVGYPNSRTLHFAAVHIVGGIPVVTPQ